MTSSNTLPVSAEKSATEAGPVEDAVEDLTGDAAEVPPQPAGEISAAFSSPVAGGGQALAGRGSLDMIKHIPVTMEILLGSTSMSVEKLVNLGRGAIIPLDRAVGEPVDVVVNGRLVARGQIVVTEENASSFSIKITEIVSAPGGAILS